MQLGFTHDKDKVVQGGPSRYPTRPMLHRYNVKTSHPKGSVKFGDQRDPLFFAEGAMVPFLEV